MLRTGSEFVTEPYSFFGERQSLPETRKLRKDFSGKPIRNIVSYVEMNFAANARDRDIAREKLSDEGFEPGSIFVPYRKN